MTIPKSNFENIPNWAMDPKIPYPCPCGQPMMGSVVAMEGEAGLVQLYHEACVQRFMTQLELDDED